MEGKCTLRTYREVRQKRRDWREIIGSLVSSVRSWTEHKHRDTHTLSACCCTLTYCLCTVRYSGCFGRKQMIPRLNWRKQVKTRFSFYVNPSIIWIVSKQSIGAILEKDSWFWVSFLGHQIPTLCIGHAQNQCSQWIVFKLSIGPEFLPFVQDIEIFQDTWTLALPMLLFSANLLILPYSHVNCDKH